MYPSNPKVRECIHKIANCFPHSTVLVYGGSDSPGCHWPHIARSIPSAFCFEQFSFTSHLMDCQYGSDEQFLKHPLFHAMRLNNDQKVLFITLDNPDSTSITVQLER
jgi:hypothetical protein